MIKKINIKNFALLKDISFEPVAGLNIITGETGAGKSIIFEALGLLLGERADSQLFEGQNEKCILEGEFAVDATIENLFFKPEDFDFESHTILRREINSNGKSRAFINDTPASLGQMKLLGNLLVNIHNQHETIGIFNKKNQLALLDGFAKNKALLEAFQSVYFQAKKIETTLFERKNHLAEIKKQESYNQFLLEELLKLNLTVQDRKLEEQLDHLSHADEIKQMGSKICNTLSDGEFSILDQIGQLQADVKKIDGFFPKSSFFERFQSIVLELKELAVDVEKETDSLTVDNESLEAMEHRFSSIQQLLKKHQTQDIDSLMVIRQNLENELNNTEELEKSIFLLENELETVLKNLSVQSMALSDARKKAIPQITMQLIELLKSLELEKAKVVFELKKAENLYAFGADDLSILFSANSDMAPMPLDKVASGGEASRLALCLKSLASLDMVTLIFDEIDSGVSGKVAQRIGELLKNIASKQQVIAVTHSPQVASCADNHIFVSKKEENGKTVTAIHYLNKEQEQNVIAQMLSGSAVTDAAMANAKTLLERKMD